MSNHDATVIDTTEIDGVRNRGLTFLSQRLPGTPSSRLNAKSIRPAEAIDEKPQKVIATAIPTASRPPSSLRPAPRLMPRMYATPPPPVLLANTSAGVDILSVSATRTM